MEITPVAKTLKYIDAGGIQIAAVYDRCRARDSERQRAAKHRASSAAQRRMNQIYSTQRLELMLSANFPAPGSALVVTLTHDDAHMPKSRKEAQARFKYFLKKLRAARAAAGRLLGAGDPHERVRPVASAHRARQHRQRL